MATNPRSAFDRLAGALENFHQVATQTDNPNSPAVLEAADALADAYTIYDDVIFTEYGVETPLDVFDDSDDDDDEDGDDDDSYDFGDYDDLDEDLYEDSDDDDSYDSDDDSDDNDSYDSDDDADD